MIPSEIELFPYYQLYLWLAFWCYFKHFIHILIDLYNFLYIKHVICITNKYMVLKFFSDAFLCRRHSNIFLCDSLILVLERTFINIILISIYIFFYHFQLYFYTNNILMHIIYQPLKCGGNNKPISWPLTFGPSVSLLTNI